MNNSLILSWIAVLLWMALIFNLSSQVADQSNQLSTGITEVIVETVEKVAPRSELDMESLNHVIRKSAHFFAYWVLGLLVVNALGRSGVHGYRSVFTAAGICILYAVSDEVHQLFVPGRGGQVQDVLIDSTGAGVGIVVYLVVSGVVRRRRETGREKNTR